MKRWHTSFTRISNRSSLKLAAVAVVVFLLCLSQGCTPTPNSQTKRTFRIGLGPWVGFGPLYLAKEKGFFGEAGLDIDLIVLTGIAERNSSLLSGTIDALAAPVDYFVLFGR